MSAATSNPPQKVVPAQLGFFAIYNPSLGTTDETIADQILYYSSRESRERLHGRGNAQPAESALREEENEQLRQIGLAQGMVEFGRSFSDGASVDTVETEKARLILHELEAGWWVIASIDLTILPPTAKGQSTKPTGENDKIEYSSREVKPAILLLGDILRAHSTFLLHHAASMSALFVRTKRSKFVALLGRYWDMFLSTWTVLMHGNPATNLYGGIKLAASGELGFGVGEEERGSGEREVLEGFVGRIDGLVDVIVSKFGDTATSDEKSTTSKAQPVSPWLGSGSEPAASDGVVFVGTGALSRKSIRDVSHWIEDLYRWGPYAYGVLDNPSSNRRTRRPKRSTKGQRSASPSLTPRPTSKAAQESGVAPGGPSRENSQQSLSSVDEISKPKVDRVRKRPSFTRLSSHTSTESEVSAKAASKLVQYLKLGYGTHWTLGHNSNSNQKSRASSAKRGSSSMPSAANITAHEEPAVKSSIQLDEQGHYLVGFLGDLEDAKYSPGLTPDDTRENGDEQNEDEEGENDRVLLRTLTVELERVQDARAEAEISIDLGSTTAETQASLQGGSERTGKSSTSFESLDRNKTKKLRVVVYVKRPFVFVMLFELRTEVLSMPGLYRSLHHQLSPLHKPLLKSTTYKPLRPEVSSSEDTTPIYDLIWDPKSLTVSSNIPNIPDPYHVHYLESASPAWSRVEALNTHMQIILTYTSATGTPFELERTCKTSRGWWIVWTRIPYPDDPPAAPLSQGNSKRPAGMITDDRTESSSLPVRSRTTQGGSTAGTSVSGPAHPFLESKQKVPVILGKEIFLIRRASDHAASKAGSRFSNSSANDEAWTSNPGKLVQGIGVDTKWYIESLLNLNK